jgi:hypothetical protein
LRYYGKANLDEKAMRAVYKRDNGTFVFAALYNDHIFFSTAKLRKLLEEECLAGGLIGRYRKRFEQLHERWRGFNPRPQAEWLRDGEVEDPNKANESVRYLTLLDRKLNYFAGVLFSLVTIATWVVVFYLVQSLLDRFLGPEWHGLTTTVAVICALIAGGAAQQYVERQFHKADP